MATTEYPHPFFHNDLLARLAREARAGRVAQGLMLCGPAGTGKLRLALEYARYLCCNQPAVDGKACGECPSCRLWSAWAHPDAHFVYPVLKDGKRKRETCDDYLPLWRGMLTDNPYADLEEWTHRMDSSTSAQPLIFAHESDVLTRKLSLKASTATGRRLVLMWLPERMHEACANKLLKLLEEPPQGTVFLLVSQEPERVIATVKSRVQRLDVPPITEDELEMALTDRGATLRQAHEAAHGAAGSWPRALAYLTEDEDRMAMLTDFTDLMRTGWKRQAKEMKVWSERMAATGRTRQAAFLKYTGQMLRESFISNLHRPELEHMSEGEREFVRRFGPFVNERNIQRLAELTALAQEHIERNVNPRMVFFDYILKVTVELKK